MLFKYLRLLTIVTYSIISKYVEFVLKIEILYPYSHKKINQVNSCTPKGSHKLEQLNNIYIHKWLKDLYA